MLAETIKYFSEIAFLELLAVIFAFAYVIFAAGKGVFKVSCPKESAYSNSTPSN